MGLLELVGVRKEFPGVVALDGVDFSLEAGEIRALMGENGAGKSTLIKVLTGVHPPDGGTMVLDGYAIRPKSPSHAQALGISTVYQEVNLVPNLSVAENICLGTEPRRMGAIDWRGMKVRARAALARLDIDLDVSRPLSAFSIAIQQLVSIARALDREARVLVLDEPTSSLDKDECERLFGLMRTLRERGMAIVFVTHFLDQVYGISDSITVLRNGQLVGNWRTAELTQQELVTQMLGRTLSETGHDVQREAGGEVAVRVSGLGRRKALQPVSFEIRSGEVLALAGLLGSGRTETMRLVFGADASDSGKVESDGTLRRPKSPAESIRAGFGLCPEDRKADGICPGLSVRENILLVKQAKRGWLRRIPAAKQREVVDGYIASLSITTPDAERPIENLSGGNQQKALLARWLASDPKLLILDEPTRGVDVGSKLDIRNLIRDLASKGLAFLFTSSELEEVVHTADRVIVLRDRAQVGELAGEDVTEDAIMARIAGGGA